jgi:rhodanese-related sulfurtransferase
MVRTVDRDSLLAKLGNPTPPRLVEALPEKYYRDWHLPGALHLSLEELESSAARVLPDRDAEIVVYCASASCRNSDAAARRLAELGYRNVAVYSGGKQDWHEAGLPVEHDARGLAA